MKLYARQGDLVIHNYVDDNKTLTPTNHVSCAGDSSGHTHTISGKLAVFRDGLNTRINVLEDTHLIHNKAGGHKSIPLPAGQYLITPKRERGDATDRTVTD
jgi:hypothetical protein